MSVTVRLCSCCIFPLGPSTFRFSGLIAEHFIGVEATLEDVQHQLLQMFCSDTILLGHSLESDLRALKVLLYTYSKSESPHH